MHNVTIGGDSGNASGSGRSVLVSSTCIISITISSSSSSSGGGGGGGGGGSSVCTSENGRGHDSFGWS